MPPKEGKTKSSRPSWSCVSCTKKKIKCDKVVPCSSCIKRGIASECKLIDQDPSLPARNPASNPHLPQRKATETEFNALRQTVSTIRQRLYHVESVLAGFVPEQVLKNSKTEETAYAFDNDQYDKLLETRKANSTASTTSETPNPFQSRSANLVDGDVEAAETLEYLALGRDQKSEHFARSEVRRIDLDPADAYSPTVGTTTLGDIATSPLALPSINTPNDSLSKTAHPFTQASLPSIEQGTLLIRFSLEFCTWQHCAVHPATFLKELETFNNWGDQRESLVNHAWLALYFALLCCGVKNMDAFQLDLMGIAADQQMLLAKQYFDSAISSLYRANFMLKHSVYSVQCTVVLSFSALDIGGTDFISVLQTSAIRIAQHLMLHRFTSDEEWTQRQIEKRGSVDPQALITREIRKRLWWSLTTDDWYGAATRRPFTISPRHMTTPEPLHCTDEDLLEGITTSRPQSDCTVTTKLLHTIKIATVIRRYFEESVDGLSLDKIQRAEREIRAIVVSGPPFLRDSFYSQPHPQLPMFASWFRRYFSISAEHKILVIHRVFLSTGPGKMDRSYSRTAMLEASKTILGLYNEKNAQGGAIQSIWTCAYHAITAATALLLDTIQNPPEDPLQTKGVKDIVERTILTLDSVDKMNGIANRGVQLLSALVVEVGGKVPLDSKFPRAGKRTVGDTDFGGRAGTPKRLVIEPSLPDNLAVSPSTSNALLSSTSASFHYPVQFAPSTIIEGIAVDSPSSFSFPTSNSLALDNHHLLNIFDDSKSQTAFDWILGTGSVEDASAESPNNIWKVLQETNFYEPA